MLMYKEEENKKNYEVPRSDLETQVPRAREVLCFLFFSLFLHLFLFLFFVFFPLLTESCFFSSLLSDESLFPRSHC